jgi:hypothetical protein
MPFFAIERRGPSGFHIVPDHGLGLKEFRFALARIQIVREELGKKKKENLQSRCTLKLRLLAATPTGRNEEDCRLSECNISPVAI